MDVGLNPYSTLSSTVSTQNWGFNGDTLENFGDKDRWHLSAVLDLFDDNGWMIHSKLDSWISEGEGETYVG